MLTRMSNNKQPTTITNYSFHLNLSMFTEEDGSSINNEDRNEF